MSRTAASTDSAIAEQHLGDLNGVQRRTFSQVVTREEQREADKKKANPARIWVQIATGSNPKALAFDYNRFAKRNAALFKGKSGSTAEWGQTRRLLVGPPDDARPGQPEDQ